eukprot:7597383-Pyramimonas_sp.AAC.1
MPSVSTMGATDNHVGGSPCHRCSRWEPRGGSFAGGGPGRTRGATRLEQGADTWFDSLREMYESC